MNRYRKFATSFRKPGNIPNLPVCASLLTITRLSSKNFVESEWKQSQTFEIPGGKSGSIEVFYLKEFPEMDEGPFMKEERDLIDNLPI